MMVGVRPRRAKGTEALFSWCLMCPLCLRNYCYSDCPNALVEQLDVCLVCGLPIEGCHDCTIDGLGSLQRKREVEDQDPADCQADRQKQGSAVWGQVQGLSVPVLWYVPPFDAERLE